MATDLKCCGTEFFLYVLEIVGLVAFAGLMAGLTLGLMSLGLVDLEVLIKPGHPQDRIHTAKIFPVVKNQHLLLCTLLIGNSLALEALPIFLDKLVPPWAAVVISVTLILMFGEVCLLNIVSCLNSMQPSSSSFSVTSTRKSVLPMPAGSLAQRSSVSHHLAALGPTTPPFPISSNTSIASSPALPQEVSGEHSLKDR